MLTPEQLIDLWDFIKKNFDLEDLYELSIELNPYPIDEIYNLIKMFNVAFFKVNRVRYSFGIQTFDNQILNDVWRPVSFGWLMDFIRWLRDLKQENNIMNFDFIAFGKFGETKKWEKHLWDPSRINFFEKFVGSWFADSFSLYTLELFPWSKRQSKTPDKPISGSYYGSDDDIYEEFNFLKQIILDAGYTRYEASNFCKAGKSSIHNRVYREMENYLGFGPSASSFIRFDKLGEIEWLEDLGGLDKKDFKKAIRWTNTSNLNEYFKWNFIDPAKIDSLTDKDILIESFFLWLRTDIWLKNIDQYSSILISIYKELIEKYKDEWFFYDDEERLVLTDQWMDLSNTIITDLLNEV